MFNWFKKEITPEPVKNDGCAKCVHHVKDKTHPRVGKLFECGLEPYTCYDPIWGASNHLHLCVCANIHNLCQNWTSSNISTIKQG